MCIEIHFSIATIVKFSSRLVKKPTEEYNGKKPQQPEHTAESLSNFL